MRQNSLFAQSPNRLKISDDGHIFRSFGMTKAKDTSARATTRARRAKQAGDLSQSASPQRCIALIHFRIRLRVRNADHKTMVEKNTNDGSAIGGSCRGELRVIRLGHCHTAWPTVEGPQFRKSAGGDRSH